MKYTVILSSQAERSYKKLEDKIKGQVRDCLIGLEEEAYSGKRLHGDLKGNFSFRIGKTRIIYTVSEKDKTVNVISMGGRNTIYQ